MENRRQLRELLLPGMYVMAGKRGDDFTEEEVEQVIDAYVDAEDKGESGSRAASRCLEQLEKAPKD